MDLYETDPRTGELRLNECPPPYAEDLDILSDSYKEIIDQLTLPPLPMLTGKANFDKWYRVVKHVIQARGWAILLTHRVPKPSDQEACDKLERTLWSFTYWILKYCSKEVRYAVSLENGKHHAEVSTILAVLRSIFDPHVPNSVFIYGKQLVELDRAAFVEFDKYVKELVRLLLLSLVSHTPMSLTQVMVHLYMEIRDDLPEWANMLNEFLEATPPETMNFVAVRNWMRITIEKAKELQQERTQGDAPRLDENFTQYDPRRPTLKIVSGIEYRPRVETNRQPEQQRSTHRRENLTSAQNAAPIVAERPSRPVIQASTPNTSQHPKLPSSNRPSGLPHSNPRDREANQSNTNTVPRSRSVARNNAVNQSSTNMQRQSGNEGLNNATEAHSATRNLTDDSRRTRKRRRSAIVELDDESESSQSDMASKRQSSSRSTEEDIAEAGLRLREAADVLRRRAAHLQGIQSDMTYTLTWAERWLFMLHSR